MNPRKTFIIVANTINDFNSEKDNPFRPLRNKGEIKNRPTYEGTKGFFEYKCMIWYIIERILSSDAKKASNKVQNKTSNRIFINLETLKLIPKYPDIRINKLTPITNKEFKTIPIIFSGLSFATSPPQYCTKSKLKRE